MAVQRVPVLVYHDVQAAPRGGFKRWTTSPERFRQHTDVIAQSGRVPWTIAELAECLRGERRLEREAVVLTFDDGYAGTYEAASELARRGLRATIYIVSGKIGEEGMLTAEQIQGLARLEGIEIGAHTVSHPRLDEISGDVLEQEIVGSKHALETLLNAPVVSFAYPYGSHDRRSRAAVIDAGFRSAAAIKNAISHLEDDPFAIARWTVTAHTSPEELTRVLRGEGVRTARAREHLRTRAWRAARRARRRLPILRNPRVQPHPSHDYFGWLERFHR
jgi:peptidoglycan/xylan/chitin deacetylase (PgdA/CDA1 family)